MKVIVFFFNRWDELLYVEYLEPKIDKVAGVTHNQYWKHQIKKVMVSDVIQDDVGAIIYKEYYIRKYCPKYNSSNYEIQIPENLQELYFTDIRNQKEFEIDWSTAVTSAIGGGIIGGALIPGIGWIVGGGLGLILGSRIGKEALRLIKVITTDQ